MVMEQFDMLAHVIDLTLGQRCSIIGYQFSEIVRSLMSVYFCGGSCVEDVTSHLMRHLSYHPTLRTCRSDTILHKPYKNSVTDIMMDIFLCFVAFETTVEMKKGRILVRPFPCILV